MIYVSEVQCLGKVDRLEVFQKIPIDFAIMA